MKFILKYLSVILLFVMTSFTSIASAENVAIMASPNTIAWNVEVQNKLTATGFFSTVDVFNIQTVTPSLAQMQTYDALLVYTNGAGFADATTFGNNLADYIDGGGGVVAAVFATASIPIQGRFNTDNYWAIQPTSQQGTLEGLGTIFDASSPILNGVITFSGGASSFRPSSDNLHPNATRIANWTGPGNIPLIATRVINSTCRVDLGFFPPSDDSRADFWDATTDGDLIMANALLTVMEVDCETTQVEVEKDYRFTDVCFERDNDLDGLFGEDCVETVGDACDVNGDCASDLCVGNICHIFCRSY